MLQVKNLSISFGGLQALSGVNFHLQPGEITGLIGPNGAGKTTLLNMVSGIYRPDEGNIFLEGQDITALPPHLRTAKGIGRTFQIQHLFSNMTVLENVLTGLHKHIQAGFLATAFRSARAKAEEKEARERALKALRFFRLETQADRMISDLSSIEQRMVEIARVLAAEHAVILLDEPAAGLSPSMVTEMNDILKRIRDEKGGSILLVEHVLPLVLAVSDRITVLNFGRVIAEGTPEEIKKNPAVLEAYLGKDPAYA